MKIYSLIVFALLTFTVDAQVDSLSDNRYKEQLIKEMLYVQGSHLTYEVTIDNMMETFKKTMPGADVSALDTLATEMKSEVESMLDLLVPIYDKYYTERQIQDVINFYQSDLGKHIVENQPTIITESMQAGQAWGMQLGAKVMQKMSKLNKSHPPMIAVAEPRLVNCDELRTGEFEVLNEDGSMIYISRTENLETHTRGDIKQRFVIEWTDSCEYTLKPKNDTEGLTIHCKIHSFEDDKVVFSAKRSDTESTKRGRAKKIK